MVGTETAQEMTGQITTDDSSRSSRWWLRHDAQSVVVDAPAERIYDLVADLPRMGEWSPECRRWSGSTGRPVRRRGPDSSATTRVAPAAS